MISRDTYIELTKFGIVGSLCFGLDLVLYYTLTEYFGAPTYLGKSISVISATFLNYYLNKTWTWGQSNRDSKRFAKYLAQKPFLTIKLNKLFAVIGATVVGMVVNYIGQKLWVFKEETPTDK